MPIARLLKIIRLGSTALLCSFLGSWAGAAVRLSAASDGVDFSSGLLAYYPFDGNASDAVGTNHGSVFGAALAVDRFGHRNQAYSFDGVKDFIRCGDYGFPAGNAPRTISIWVFFRSFGVPSPRDTPFVSYGSGKPNDTYYAVLFGQTRLNNPIAVGQSLGGDTPQWAGTQTNQWYHVVFSHDGANTKLFLNGELKGTSIRTFNTVPSGTFFIGQYIDTTPPLDGLLDDVRVYNRVLNDAEVKALYDFERQPLVAPTAGLVAHYPFNGNANDTSGNGRHGLTFGARLVSDRFGKPGSAYAFEKPGEHVVVIDSLHPQGEATLTYSCWVNWRAKTGHPEAQTVLNVASIGANGTFIPNTRSGLLIRSAPELIYVGENNDFGVRPNVIQPDTWRHVAVVKKQTSVMIFLNGVLQNQISLRAGQNISSKQLYIGWNGSPSHEGGEQFLGEIDDVRIYNRALSISEIAALFRVESQPPPSEPPLLNWFTLPRLAYGRIQGLRIALAPQDGNAFRIEFSTDLSKWAPLITFPTNSGPFEFIDSTALVVSNRFYRAVRP